MDTTKRPITPEDMAGFTRLADAQISPDGALVAFVAGDAFVVDTKQPRSRIWVAPTNGGAPRPLTGGPRADDSPRWSPDGRALAFRSDRLEDGKFQLYLLARDGGEARRLADLPNAPEALAWSPDGTQLAFLMADPQTDEERRRKQAGDDAIEVEKNHKWRRVWTVDIASGETRQITGAVQVWEFGWAPDNGFVLIVGAEPYEWSWFLPRLACVGSQGGQPQTIYSAPEKQLACPRVSPDGRQVALLSCIWSDRGWNAGDVLLLPRAGGPARNLTEDYAGSVWWIQWTPDGAALDYMAYEDGQAAIGRIDVTSGARTLRWRGPAAFYEANGSGHIARDTGTIAVIREGATHPQDIWIAQDSRPDQERARRQNSHRAGDDPRGDPAVVAPADQLVWHRLTDLHPQLGDLALGETRELRWRAADGMAIQGLLILPPGYREGRRLPLITWVHGGPAWLYTHAFYGAGRSIPQMLAGAGYAVLLPNPRGSTGWGVPFTEAAIGDFGGADYQDIVAGIDDLIARGIADPARLGIGGWSYGGFMSAWAIGQTDRFKAAIVGAAITHWRSFHGVADIGTWDQVSLRAAPYETGGRYDCRSPLSYVKRIKTPTLMLHGQDDIIVPVSQSYELFRALKDHGVPAELAVYPREPHSLQERAHNLDRFRRILAWFQRYLD